MKKIKIIDHKKIGYDLNMFFFDKNYNIGLPIWLSNGLFLYKKLKNLIKLINLKYNYIEVKTPYLGNYNLYYLSGHIKNYYKNIFKLSYNKEIFLKPMNCPYHCLIYKKKYNKIYYNKLPKKIFEFGTVFRNEKSGVLNGLFRTKVFTQDDGHIFCTEKQIKNEIYKLIKIIIYIFKIFKFKNFNIRFSFKNEKKKYIKNNKIWEKSQYKLLKIKNKIEKKYNIKIKIINGEAAFYGPKIDFIIKDNLNREWQLSTIQIDYYTPKKFNLKYLNKKKKYKNPIMIHRAFLGSIERFIGILLEHTKGDIPFWLFKIQLVIIPIHKNNYLYSNNILLFLIKNGIRCILDNSKKNLNQKIKKYEKKKIPLILIIGDKEVKNNKITIRKNNKIKIYNKKIAIKNIIKYNKISKLI